MHVRRKRVSNEIFLLQKNLFVEKTAILRWQIMQAPWIYGQTFVIVISMSPYVKNLKRGACVHEQVLEF